MNDFYFFFKFKLRLQHSEKKSLDNWKRIVYINGHLDRRAFSNQSPAINFELKIVIKNNLHLLFSSRESNKIQSMINFLISCLLFTQTFSQEWNV